MRQQSPAVAVSCIPYTGDLRISMGCGRGGPELLLDDSPEPSADVGGAQYPY